MPRFRRDVQEIARYQPGQPIEEVAREIGLDPGDIAKLASNESPLPPFPEVQEAIADAAADVHRYPDDECHYLRQAVATHLDVPPDHLWFGGGSTELIGCTAQAVGGPGMSAVYAWPSFVMYPLATKIAGAGGVAVPLDDRLCHDLEAMTEAVRSDTTIVYVCNPNNPTGTYVSGEALYEFVDALPNDVLVLVDEAYFEYVQAPDFDTAVPLALERDNVVVARTFSKVYGLAGLRVGYAVGRPETLGELHKAQIPFSVSVPAQVAAIESLRHQDRLAERVALNVEGVKLFSDELAARAIPFAESQTNFVFCRLSDDEQRAKDLFLERGIIIRPVAEGWQRVTVGTPEENRRFFEVLDEVADRL
jgi:histidinol-phosphate aminotransferase